MRTTRNRNGDPSKPLRFRKEFHLPNNNKTDAVALLKADHRAVEELFAQFEKAVAKLKFVLDCHLVAGDFDYFLKIRVGDMADFNRIHGEQLIALPGVRQTRTFFVMKEVVDSAPLDF